MTVFFVVGEMMKSNFRSCDWTMLMQLEGKYSNSYANSYIVTAQYLMPVVTLCCYSRSFYTHCKLMHFLWAHYVADRKGYYNSHQLFC